jgi:hypothetical protein
MTVIDLTPRLAAARRKRKTDRAIAWSAPFSDLFAAQMRLALLPTLFGCLLTEELGRYAQAMLGVAAAPPPARKPG